jgi:Ca2+/Na+ antiporter
VIYELIAFLGAAGIAVIIFAVIMLLSDRPAGAFIVALILLYLLYPTYIVILNKILKRKEEHKEENRMADPQET